MWTYPFRLIKPLHLVGFLVLSVLGPHFLMGKEGDVYTFYLARYFPLYMAPIYYFYLNRKVGILNAERDLLIQRVGRDSFIVKGSLSIFAESMLFFLGIVLLRLVLDGLQSAPLVIFLQLLLFRFVVFMMGCGIILWQLGKESHFIYMPLAFLISIVAQFLFIEELFYDYFIAVVMSVYFP